MAQEDIYVEPAEKARNEVENAKLAKQNDVKLADLNNKFVVIKDVTDGGGSVCAEDGDRALVFGINGNDIYKIDTSAEHFDEQVADPTKGELVVELDSADSKINWKQDHIEQQIILKALTVFAVPSLLVMLGYPLL